MLIVCNYVPLLSTTIDLRDHTLKGDSLQRQNFISSIIIKTLHKILKNDLREIKRIADTKTVPFLKKKNRNRAIDVAGETLIRSLTYNVALHNMQYSNKEQ